MPASQILITRMRFNWLIQKGYELSVCKKTGKYETCSGLGLCSDNAERHCRVDFAESNESCGTPPQPSIHSWAGLFSAAKKSATY